LKRWLRDNSLSLVLFASFLVFLAGQALAGWRHFNQEQQQHRQPAVALSSYLRSGDFLEATFENWESEFFQMAAFLILSAMLVQRGSAESKPPEDEEDPKQKNEDAHRLRHPPADAPGPVLRGGLALRVYSHSLSLALTALFVLSFALHAVTGHLKYNEEARAHGAALVSLLGYVTSSTFWFESFQNWQSEFLSVFAVVVLSIFLRQKGSPESKPVYAPHTQTGQ
jgi:hypothetical protein